MKQKIRFGWCSFWLILVAQFPSQAKLATRISATQETFEATQKKEDEETHKLVLKSSVVPIKSDVDSLRFPVSERPLTPRKVKKTRFFGSFGFANKKQQRESRKWFINSQLSGTNSQPSAKLVHDPNTSKRRRKMRQKHHQTDVKPLRKRKTVTRSNARNLNFPPKMSSLQEKYGENGQAGPASNVFRISNLTRTKDLQSPAIAQLSEQHRRPNGYLRTRFHSAYQVRNNSDEPIWASHRTRSQELKFNPLATPYLQSIKWKATPNYGWARTSEPPLADQLGQNDDRSFAYLKKENSDIGEMECKGVGKCEDKKTNEVFERGHSHELIPKIHALNKLMNAKKNENNNNNRQSALGGSSTKPIIVPGFKRKHSEASVKENMSFRPYNIHAEEQNDPIQDRFIQVPRANRNQARNVAVNENKMAAGGIPVQMPPPYAFPGGINISILMPNQPAAASHENAQTTVTLSMERDKNIKKKKQRKNKVKNDDELVEEVLSEPGSLVSQVKARRFPDAEKIGVNLLTGDDERRKTGMQHIYSTPQLINAVDNVKHPLFNLKSDHFGLLNRIKNLTRKDLDWDSPLFGTHPDKVEKPHDYDEDEGDNDEIRMLYDEQTASTTKFELDEEKTTASCSRCRLSDNSSTKSSVQEDCGTGNYSAVNSAPMHCYVFGGSGKMRPKVEDDKYLSNKNFPSYKDEANGQPTGRAAIHGRSGYEIETADAEFQFQKRDGKPPDQWEILDEALKTKTSENINNGRWRVINRKREADYESHQANDDQGYYRLSDVGNSLRNPANVIMSVLKGKPNQRRNRDFYEDNPEDRIRMEHNTMLPPNFPA